MTIKRRKKVVTPTTEQPTAEAENVHERPPTAQEHAQGYMGPPRHATRERLPEPDAPFEVRDGDVMVVHYNGAKLQIANFSTVQLDGAVYSRTLKPGDNPEEEFDRIYAYLRRKTLNEARTKLREFADELAAARARAEGCRG